MEQERDFFLVEEVAAQQGAHVVTVRRWIRDGLIPAERSPGGRVLRIPKDYRERMRTKAPAEPKPAA
jgi:excisionase family DNA binding protein